MENYLKKLGQEIYNYFFNIAEVVSQEIRKYPEFIVDGSSYEIVRMERVSLNDIKYETIHDLFNPDGCRVSLVMLVNALAFHPGEDKSSYSSLYFKAQTDVWSGFSHFKALSCGNRSML
ncbi:hypothetical protein [uncultured Alistipes sp.]|jgi:hypothetical protein|uniref:hypothetical protein n=1 Tax=uncultured Alistipes sp. TaxID=538949 RepID=UPI0025CC6942|nr:hypothetical protein [uncultured Alistipes sp.]